MLPRILVLEEEREKKRGREAGSEGHMALYDRQSRVFRPIRQHHHFRRYFLIGQSTQSRGLGPSSYFFLPEELSNPSFHTLVFTS